MKKYLIAIVIIVGGFTSCDTKVLKNSAEKPNILLLFTDQHNKKVMGFESHPDIGKQQIIKARENKN